MDRTDPALPSTKPYLLRALWEWCCDNGYTPFIVVEADARARVPREHVRDGQIVLNIGQEATNRLKIGNDLIEFQARFGGVARELSIPVGQVTAIYARENGAGMAFEIEGGNTSVAEPGLVEGKAAPEHESAPLKPSSGRPGLRLVK